MPVLHREKVHKFASRPLVLVAEAWAKKAPVRGWVESAGVKRIRADIGKVEIFCPERETPRTIYYERRLFLATALQLQPPENGDGAYSVASAPLVPLEKGGIAGARAKTRRIAAISAGKV